MRFIHRLPQLRSKGDYLKQQLKDKLIEHKYYVDKHGKDLPEILNWKWKVKLKNEAYENYTNYISIKAKRLADRRKF